MNQGGLWTTENCSGIVSSGSTAQLVTSAAGGAAVSWATTAIAAGASGPLAPIVLIAGGILQVFGAIFGHHAAKVKQEQQIICAVVQSVNDSLSVIDQAVQQGVITPQQASPSLDQLYSDLQRNVQPILKQDSGNCNAACFILAEARGVIGKRKEAYAKILPPQASAKCAQEYWCLYPDVAASSMFGPSAGPAGAWAHYQGAGQFDGHVWPCDPNGNLIQVPMSAQKTACATSAGSTTIGSFNAPTWALWAVGGLLAAKLVGAI
jgi:hypothetical protein